MIAIELVTGPTDPVRALVAGLEAALAANYPPEQRHGLALAALFEPHIRFFMARLHGAPAGCGGVALLDGFAEVKRMFVQREARGQGVAQALLARIEQEAASAGLDLLQLETGTHQHAAIRLYQRAGFVRCGAFGAYASMPAEAIGTSVFMAKQGLRR